MASIDPKPLRVACAQVAFRPWTDRDAFLRHIDGFVVAAAAQSADLIVFPEWFTLGLMEPHGELGPHGAIRRHAQEAETLLSAFAAQSRRSGVWIAAGSLPMLYGDRLLNVGCLLGPQDQRFDQAKLHPTPDERELWALSGGDALSAVETPFGVVATLICYDVEFPELARRVADQGARLLITPYATDLRAGHLRVTLCARARAIENQLFVACAGNVGLAPTIPNMETHHAISAAYTPCDHGFARDGVAVEAPENVEALAIADLDLDRLDRARAGGSVRPFADRRHDLYRLSWVGDEA